MLQNSRQSFKKIQIIRRRLSVILSQRSVLIGLMMICFSAQPWNRDTGVVAYQLLVLFSCFVLFRHGGILRSLKNIRWLVVGLLLLAFTSIISWLFREYQEAPFRAVKPYILLLSIILIFLALQSFKLTQRHLLLIAFTAGLSLTVYAISEHLSGNYRRWSAVENAVDFGNYSAIIGGLLILLAVHFKGDKGRKFVPALLLIVGGIAFYASFRSGTRSSLAIVVLALVGLLLYILIAKRNWTVIGLILLSGLVAGYAIKDNPRIGYMGVELTKAMEGNYSSGSLGQRLELWRLSACIAKDTPVFGVGPGALKYAQLDKWPERCGVTIHAPRGYFYQAHSVYFQTLATLGGGGLLSLLFVFGVLVFFGVQRLNKGGIPLVFVSLSFMSAGLTVDLFFKDFLVVRFVLLVVIGLCWLQLQNYDTRRLEGVT